jgi:hypothetical protein
MVVLAQMLGIHTDVHVLLGSKDLVVKLKVRV